MRTVNKMTDIKPCPFCGGEPIMRIKWPNTKNKLISIGCPKCRLECGDWHTEAKAISVWNRRAK